MVSMCLISIVHVVCLLVILAGKRDSRPHPTTSFSENVVVAATSYQVFEV